MCKISDEIKLCTCKKEDISDVKHYWVLHRYMQGAQRIAIGSTLIPEYFTEVDHELNLEVLLHTLNERNLFDVPMKILDKDRLQLSFKFGDRDDYYHYGFEFNNGIWNTKEFDVFLWMNEHDEAASGEIKNAIEKD